MTAFPGSRLALGFATMSDKKYPKSYDKYEDYALAIYELADTECCCIDQNDWHNKCPPCHAAHLINDLADIMRASWKSEILESIKRYGMYENK